MKILNKWSILIIMVVTTVLLGACTTIYKHPRHHHRHPHRHRITVIAEQNTPTGQTATEGFLSMTKPDIYGETE